MVVVDRVDDLDRHLGDPTTAVVLYKATTDAGGAEGAGQPAPSATAPWSAELPGLPGQRLQPLAESDDGPISYLATVLFPARSPQPTRGPR